MRLLILFCPVIFLAAGSTHAADNLDCGPGRQVDTSLGDGVIMRTCLWEKAPGVVVRTGALELIRNDILILRTQTNLDGQLHGLYASWSDDGQLMERGFYDRGAKQGWWLYADGGGSGRNLYYRAGVPLGL